MTWYVRDGVTLAYDDQGLHDQPAVLFLAGNGCSAVFWPDDFCRPLMAAGYRAIRCDYRDTGRSTHRDFGAHPYTLDDLEADALGLLDHLGVPAAHVVGLSMGGFLAQRLALHHPQRVLSLVSMMATPDYDTMLHTFMGIGAPTSDLPPPSPAWLKSVGEIPLGLTALDLALEAWKLANGPHAPFDRAYWRALLETAAGHGRDEAAAHYHRLACAESAERYQGEALTRLAMPALFLQGADDPIFSPAHARRSAQLVPRGECLIVEGMGHALNPAFFGEITAAILATWKRVAR